MSQLKTLSLLILSLIYLQGSKTNPRFLQQLNPCNDNLTLHDCFYREGDEDKTIHLQRIKSGRVIAHFTTDCDFDSIKYHWSIWTEQKRASVFARNNIDNVLILPPFAVKSGIYGLQAIGDLVRKGTKRELYGECLIHFHALDPIPVIEGGTERTVPAGFDFTINGAKSVDRDVPPSSPPKLLFKWQCRVLEGPNSDFCNKEYQRSTIVVPSTEALNNQKYHFTLSVRNEDSNKWITANQTITVMSKVSQLEIICEKNCPPRASKTVPQRLTYLKAKCLKNCEGILDGSYQWTVDGTFDYQNTQFGRNTDRFIIKKGVLKSGESLRILLEVKGGHGSTVKVLQVEEPIKIKSCQVKPNRGTSLLTKFKVNCDYTGTGYSFQVYTTKNDQTVLLTQSYNIDGVEFLLPASTEAFIKIIDAEDFFDVLKLDVTSTAGTSNIDALADSVGTLIKNGDIQTAIQVTNGLIDEKVPPMRLLNNFQNFPIESQDAARQIPQIVTRLITPESESDPYRGQLASDLCRKAATIDTKYLSEEYNPRSFTFDTIESTKTLFKCVETDSKENLKALEPEQPPIFFTTPFPVLSEPVIDEQYPNYDVDDSVSEKIEKYEEISKNFISICESSLEKILLTTVEGEDTVVASTANTTAQITKGGLGGTDVKFPGGSLKVSKDVGSVNVMICVWENDPFWWSKSTTSTNVILVKMATGEKDLTRFEDANRVVLDLKKTVLVQKVLQVESIDSVVVRVDIKGGEAFFVEFHHLKVPLKVMVTVFDKPEVGQVRDKGQVVTDTNNVLYHQNELSYDVWYYLTVVPGTTSSFGISAYSKSCFSWDVSQKRWQFSCMGSQNSTKNQLICFCDHLSILSGILHNNPIKVDNITTTPDFEMVLISSRVIFITTASIFALYCLLLLLVIKKKVKGTPLYIPPDISTHCRYIYLVNVQTGRKPSSGTTSNVCIKLDGSRSASRKHLLNYPDPQKRILQWGNNDWFLVPTVRHLGDLEEVALWLDHTGRNPSWFCSCVTVLDVQTDQKWYFRFNRWFDLPPKGEVYAKIGTTLEKLKEKKEKTTLRGFWEMVSFRSHQLGFDRFTNVTLVLSIVLTCFMVCLVMYGVPKLRLSDGFAWFNEYDLYPEVVLIGVGSAGVTFAFHEILVWFFRTRRGGMVLLGVNISVVLFALVIFGFWVPITMAWLWLTSVGVSLVIYFFILKMYYMFRNFFHKKSEESGVWFNWKTLIGTIEVQRKTLFRVFGENLLRSYFTEIYRPMDTQDIKERRAEVLARTKLLTLVEDTIMFLCYITLLFLAVFANKNKMTVYNYKEMRDLVHGIHTRTKGYSTITSIAEFYSYLNETLLPTLHAQQWYSKYVVDEPGLMADFSNKLLGVARLRQKRTSRYPCEGPLMVINETCRNEYKYSTPNTSFFGTEVNELARLSKIWHYTRAHVGGYSIVIGNFGYYFGGGFIAPLGRTKFNSYVNLYYLEKNNWLERATSVVMIEFLTYNVNTNLFNAVRVVSEWSATGYFRTVSDLNTAQFLFVKDEDKVAEVVIFGSFVLVVGIFTLKLLGRVLCGKFLFLKDLWTLVDLVIVGMTYGCFALFRYRMELVKNFLDKVEKARKNEYINYYTLLFEDKSLTLLAAFLIFISTIRLWKMCRVGDFFRIVEQSILKCIPFFIILMLNHRIVLMAFAFSGYILFGAISTNFIDLFNAVVTLMVLSLHEHRGFEFDALLSKNLGFGKIYYTAYMSLNLLFSTVYIALIIDSYYKAKLVVSNQTDFTNVKLFLVKELVFYKTSLKVGLARLKAGTTSRKRYRKVTPKAEEFRYKNCVTTVANTLEYMSCIALYDLKKYVLSNEEKMVLMQRIVRSLREKSIEIFFAEKTPRGVIKVIPDKRIETIARVVEKILNYDEKKKKVKEQKYKKLVEVQLKQLDYVSKVLSTVLRLVSNIEVE